MANITQQNFITYLSSNVGSRNKTYFAQGGYPSVNAYYGTYDSKSTAHKTLCAAYGDFEDFSEITDNTACQEIPRAFTVAIEQDGTIVEYQYKKVMPENGYTASDLEKKADSVSIITNLTTDDDTKVLSASKGKALKDLIDSHEAASNPHGITASGIGAYVKPSGGIPESDLAQAFVSRIDALEADKNAALANQITSSVTVTPARFYKGVSTTVSATGALSLPSGIATSKVSSISITDGNNHTDSGSNKTSVSLSNISATNSTITFNLSASIAAPFTKTITKSGSCTACNPVYLAVVSNSVDTKEEAFTEVAKATNLVYTSSLAVTSMKGQSKSLTFTNGDRIAVICGDSGLKAKGAGMLADYNWVVNGESVTDNGITYKVYISGALQAETRTINFS